MALDTGVFSFSSTGGGELRYSGCANSSFSNEINNINNEETNHHFSCRTLLLSSCGIYTKYERPEVKTDGLYGQDIEVEDTTSIASLSWRELFTDPQLQSLIEHALQGNTDLQSAQWRIKEAEATLSSSVWPICLLFMLTPQGGVSSFDKSKGSWTYSGIASASWEIDIFGN